MTITIDQALTEIEQRIEKQCGDHPSTHLTLGDPFQARATQLLAQQVERVTKELDTIAGVLVNQTLSL